MLEFKKLDLDDIKDIEKYFKFSKNRICDYSVGSMIIWRNYFSIEFAIYKETLITKWISDYGAESTAFKLPLGVNFLEAVDAIEFYCKQQKIPLVFCDVTSSELDWLRSQYRELRITPQPGWGDYLYHAHDLVKLEGRKYSGQRNHLNFFNREYAYSFEQITADNVEEVKSFYEYWHSTRIKSSSTFNEEYPRLLEILNNYERFGLLGDILRVDNKIIAFSIGERINDTLFIHIEKADLNYRGSYQKIMNDFAKHYTTSEIYYINREEDVGDEGLRKSKESYHPCQIIEKYIALVVK